MEEEESVELISNRWTRALNDRRFSAAFVLPLAARARGFPTSIIR